MPLELQFYQNKLVILLEHIKLNTGIPLFMLLMWGHKKKNCGSKNRVNRGYLVVLKNYKPREIKNCGNRNHGNRGMLVLIFVTLGPLLMKKNLCIRICTSRHIYQLQYI